MIKKLDPTAKLFALQRHKIAQLAELQDKTKQNISTNINEWIKMCKKWKIPHEEKYAMRNNHRTSNDCHEALEEEEQYAEKETVIAASSTKEELQKTKSKVCMHNVEHIKDTVLDELIKSYKIVKEEVLKDTSKLQEIEHKKVKILR